MAILTLSREYGSGGREIARIVADELGYGYEDRGSILAHLRERHPGWVRWAEELDERRPSAWERFDWSFRGYVALMQAYLLEAAARDRVVIVGRGGHLLLAGVATVHRIRVTAPLEARVERLRRRENTDRESVRRLVGRVDAERAGFIRAVYGRDWADPASFDAVHDTGERPLGEIVALVKAALAARDGADRAAAAGLIAARVDAARVRVALFTDARLQLPVLAVAEEGGGLVVRGVVRTAEERARVQETACTVAVALPLRFDLHFRTS
jgi:cytidylate kinase